MCRRGYSSPRQIAKAIWYTVRAGYDNTTYRGYVRLLTCNAVEHPLSLDPACCSCVLLDCSRAFCVCGGIVNAKMGMLVFHCLLFPPRFMPTPPGLGLFLAICVWVCRSKVVQSANVRIVEVSNTTAEDVSPPLGHSQPRQALRACVVLRHHALHHRRHGGDIAAVAGDLANLKFAFLHVALEHTLAGTAAATELFHLLLCRSALGQLAELLAILVEKHAGRHRLLHSEPGLTLLTAGGALLEGIRAGALLRDGKASTDLHAVRTQGHGCKDGLATRDTTCSDERDLRLEVAAHLWDERHRGDLLQAVVATSLEAFRDDGVNASILALEGKLAARHHMHHCNALILELLGPQLRTASRREDNGNLLFNNEGHEGVRFVV